MAIRDVFKLTRKTFVNPTGWVDYDAVKNQTVSLWGILKTLFTVPTSTRIETYEQALERLEVTDAEVQQRAHLYRLYTLGFCLLGSVVFIYSFYLVLVYKTFSGLLLGLCASAAFFCQAFRFDFWAFQMKRRKLGATFAEWKNSLLGDKGAPE